MASRKAQVPAAAAAAKRFPVRADLEAVGVRTRDLKFHPEYDKFYAHCRPSKAADKGRWSTYWVGALSSASSDYFCPSGWRRFSLNADTDLSSSFWKQSTIM